MIRVRFWAQYLCCLLVYLILLLIEGLNVIVAS